MGRSREADRPRVLDAVVGCDDAEPARQHSGELRGHRGDVDTPRLGNQRLANLDAARIQALYGELSASGRRDGGPLSPRSVRYVHAILRHALGDAVRWGVLPRNPAQFVDPPRQQRAELKVWSVDQVRAFLEHVAGDRLHALWLLMIATGMRRGEALGLRWNDVDFQGGAIAILRSRVVTDGWTVAESKPKTEPGAPAGERRSGDRGRAAGMAEGAGRRAAAGR